MQAQRDLAEAVERGFRVLDDHIAEIDANAQFNAAVRPDTGVPLGHRLLYSDRAAHRIDGAGKLYQQAVAGGLDDAAMVLGDFWIDQFTPQRKSSRSSGLRRGRSLGTI